MFDLLFYNLRCGRFGGCFGLFGFGDVCTDKFFSNFVVTNKFRTLVCSTLFRSVDLTTKHIFLSVSDSNLPSSYLKANDNC